MNNNRPVERRHILSNRRQQIRIPPKIISI